MTTNKNSRITLNRLDIAAKKVKVNTLYCQLIELHKTAANNFKERLRLDVQYNISKQLILDAQYLEIEKEINKVKLQLLFLKN